MNAMNYLFEAFDEFNNGTKSQNEIENFIAEICYETMEKPDEVHNLVAFSEIQPTEILHFLAQEIKDLIKCGNNNVFFGSTSFLKRYNQGVYYHQLILMYHGISFLSDLICKILAKYKPSDAGTFLSRTGIKLCTFKYQIPKLGERILRRWAIIFSIISETNFSLISQSFYIFTDLSQMENAFLLIHFIRNDHDPEFGRDFMGRVLQTLKNLKTKKIITSTILLHISDLFMSFPYEPDIYHSFMDFGMGLVNDKVIGPASIYLCSTIYSNMPQDFASKHFSFFKTYVLPLLDNSKPIWPLLCLRYAMIGKSIDPKCYFWDLGETERVSPLFYIKANTMPNIQPKDPKSFQYLFMQYYFQHLSFSENSEMISKILIHLAALDFDYFLSQITPQFVKLEYTSPKLMTLFMCVPWINHPDFQQITGVSPDKIEDFNILIRNSYQRVFDHVLKYENPEKSYVPLSILVENLVTILQADLSLSELIDAWGLEGLTKIQSSFNNIPIPFIVKREQRIMLEALKYIYNKNDFQDKRVITILMKFVVSEDAKVTQIVFDIIFSIYTNRENDILFHKLLEFIFDFLLQPQIDFNKILIYLVIVRKFTDEFKQNFDEKECIDLIALSRIYMYHSQPEIRLVAADLMKKFDSSKTLTFAVTVFRKIEEIVKQRIMNSQINDLPGNPSIPDGEIKFTTAMASRYMDIWLYFVSEMEIAYVQKNSEKVRKRILEIIPFFISMLTASGDEGDLSDVSYLVSFFSYHVDERGALITKQFYPMIQPETNYTLVEDFRPQSFSLMTSLLSHKFNWCKKVVFKAMDLCHPFYLPSFFGILPSVNKDSIPYAAQTMIRLLRSLYLDTHHIRQALPKITNFLTALQSYFVSQSINNPRVISWDESTEQTVLQAHQTIKCFCIIIQYLINKLGSISTDDWPLSSREVAFRFLVNWASTKSEALSDVRQHSLTTIETIIKYCQIFSDPYIFDDTAIRLLAQNNSLTVLTNLLRFHPDILMVNFIDNCFLQQRSFANSFFDAICDCITDDNINILYKQCPTLIFLALVYKKIDYPLADTMIERLLLTYSKFPEKEGLESIRPNLPISAFPQYFGFAIEGIFAAAFHYINLPTHHISPESMVDVIKPFTKSLRFLPKQRHCSQEIIEDFAYYTPYQFLEELMKVTQAIDLDNFNCIMSIWKELIVSPDHVDIVPTFIFSWSNHQVISNIISSLIESNTCSSIFSRLVDGISFGHYYHVTYCLNEDLAKNFWTTNILSTALKHNRELFTNSMPNIIHFALLFSEVGAYNLLDACCYVYNIPAPNPNMTNDTIRKLVNIFSHKISDIEKWGRISMKWVIGSKSVKISAKSLLIYNQIKKPVERLIITGVCKSVSYHLTNSTSDVDSLCLLVSNAFEFYDNVFDDNELYCFSFISAFFDCRMFFDSIYHHGVHLCLKTLADSKTNAQGWNSIIQMIRPLLPYAAVETKAQEILEEIISSSNSDELMLAVSPLKECIPKLFESSLSFSELLETSSQTSLENALGHFGLLLEKASSVILESIFDFSSKIIPKIKPEKCYPALSRLYRSAISSINEVKSAFTFIKVIGKSAPAVPTLQILDFSDWNRSTEEILRDLSHLPNLDSSVPKVTITDCKSIASVYNLLSSDLVPKILPFATQKEMMDGMIAVSNTYQKRKHTLRRSETVKNTSSNVPTTRKSASKRRDSNLITLELTSTPLSHPKRILKSENTFTLTTNTPLFPSLADFNEAGKTDYIS